MDPVTSLPTCYRHPDRETRLACSSCERPVCVDCVQAAAVGQKCQECARPDSGARVLTAEDVRAGSSLRASAPVSMAILALCAGIFVLGFVVGGPGGRAADPLFTFGAQANQLVAAGQWYRLVTSAFLHADLMHILFNMWALYVFGPPLEREAGSVAFGLLYLASALAGGAAFFLLQPEGLAVGASGAIFGLFGAWLAASLRSRHTIAGQAHLRQLLVLLGINLALPLVLPSIAWQAHLGGLVAGFAIALAWTVVGTRQTGGALGRAAVAAAVAGAALAAVVL